MSETPDPADHPVHWIDDRAGVEAVAARVAGHDEVALDVEANSLHAYHERVCVVQLTLGDETWLVDPLALEDLDPLRQALDTDRVEVVLHGGDYDIATLSRDHAFVFYRVFDTMIAATMLGEPKVGLADLVREAFGIELDKRYQRADWARRPLDAAQLDYLHRDTAYLPALRSRLGERLAEADLVEESEIEFRHLASRRGTPLAFDPDGWRRTKGASRLDALGRAVAAALWRWRDEEAARRDVPPFKVIGPKTILGLAEQPPVEASHPGQIRSLYPKERSRYGQPILEAIRRAERDVAEGRAPVKVTQPPISAEERAARRRAREVEEALRAWRRAEAEQRRVPNLVVLPNRALAWLTREEPRDLRSLDACDDIGPKRCERYGEAILRVIATGKPPLGKPPLGKPPLGKPPLGKPPMGKPPMGRAR